MHLSFQMQLGATENRVFPNFDRGYTRFSQETEEGEGEVYVNVLSVRGEEGIIVKLKNVGIYTSVYILCRFEVLHRIIDR
jgi:hypothetical protein